MRFPLVPFDKEKKFSWNFGSQVVDSFSAINMLSSQKMILSLEWLANDLNETGTWNLFAESERYSIDVRVMIGDEAMFPVNSLSERSSTRRYVKFLKHRGRIPST